jgi:type VI secretion system protein ImpA
MSRKNEVPLELSPAHDWMVPVDPATPCGADLEYDPEFVVLFAQVAAKVEAQYGDFVGTPEPVNWSEVDRECKRLMIRSKDIRLGVLYTRCRTRLDAGKGLAEGLNLIARWLEEFPDSVHPQPGVDEDKDAALEIRMNALQALTDSDGLLADVRDIALARSSVARLQVRDVERAFAQPRPSDALSVESVTRQLEDVRKNQPALIRSFDDAITSLTSIDMWNQTHLGAFTADLAPLLRLITRITTAAVRVDRASSVAIETDAAKETDSATEMIALTREADSITAEVVDAGRHSTQRPSPSEPLPDRDAALQSMRQAREWFEMWEPSSPIPVLLRRAEQLIGKRYAEVLKAIPADLMLEWDKEA